MTNTLFLQSEVADPYTLYASMRADHPVHYDEGNRIWAVYSYADCKHVLESGAAHIPGQNTALPVTMNDASKTLIAHFARLANPPRHAARREAVMRLLGCMRKVDAGQLLWELAGAAREFDWVGVIGKKLPALSILRAFGFGDDDTSTLLPKIERLTKIMLPNKTAARIEDVNVVADEVFFLVARHLSRAFPALAESDESRRLHASNLTGLLVQSVDAGRGILCNALLPALRQQRLRTKEEWQRLVVETLRFDPPIQNTRRVLAEDMALGGYVLPRGATVLVVLASANRDAEVFAHADSFNPARGNNAAHLTFGAGAHGCAARHFSTALAADALSAFFSNGRRVEPLQEQIAYEAMVNARLPLEIRLRYSS